MLVTLLVAPIKKVLPQYGEVGRYRTEVDVNPADRTMTVSPFDIRNIVPIEYYPDIQRQCPAALSVVTCWYGTVMGHTVIPVMTGPSEMNEIWNRALVRYAEIMPREVRAKTNAD